MLHDDGSVWEIRLKLKVNPLLLLLHFATYLVSCVGEPDDEMAESAQDIRFFALADLSAVVSIGFGERV